MGEAMFDQKNYQAAANAFRSALGGDGNPSGRKVWGHIYIGKIYDLLGQRERAVNEYSLAQHTRDNTAAPRRKPAAAQASLHGRQLPACRRRNGIRYGTTAAPREHRVGHQARSEAPQR